MIRELAETRYQLVILDCPYDTWDSPQTRDLFVKVIGLKFQGYLMSYPYGALPVDTTDFVGTHHILCEVGKDSLGPLQTLTPLMAYKSISLSRCNLHRLPLPIVSLLQVANATEHLKEVKKIIAQATENHHEIAYDGSWTMQPDIRKNKVQSEQLKEIMTAINFHYHTENHIPEVIGLGLLRFKTERYFKEIGYEQVSLNGNPLPAIEMKSLQDEPVVLMHLKIFSEEAKRLAEKFRALWEKRIEISDTSAGLRLGSQRKAA